MNTEPVPSSAVPTRRRIPEPPSIRPSTPIILAHPDRLNVAVVVRGECVTAKPRNYEQATLWLRGAVKVEG